MARKFVSGIASSVSVFCVASSEQSPLALIMLAPPLRRPRGGQRSRPQPRGGRWIAAHQSGGCRVTSCHSDQSVLVRCGLVRSHEIGVGTGTNLEFYPAGSRLYCIDPNKEFEVFFRRACLEKAAHLDPDIRFVVERGESMRSVADGSVDVVVSTLVLCSVTHLDEVLHEVRRVLVPGGKFFFLEHVGHPAGTWRRRLQNALSNSGLWPSLYDGCVLNKPTVEALMSAGFSKVDHRLAMMKDKQLKPSSTPLSGPGLISPIAYGEATK